MFKRALFFVLCSLFISAPVMSAEEVPAEAVNDYQYFLLEPDIITNYIKPGNRIGFVRVTIELMVKSKNNYAILEKNEPLIRDKIITIFGQQTEVMVKSTTERDTMRIRFLQEVNDVLFTETGQKPIEDLLFTKFLYQ